MAPNVHEPTDLWDLAAVNYSEAVVAHLLDLLPGQRPAVADVRRQEIIKQLATPLDVDEDHLAEEQRISWRCHLLSRVIPQTELTYLEYVRSYVGGRSSIRTGDDLVDAFARLVFNGLAMEHVPGAEWDRFSISAAFQDPTLCNPAAAAFLDDPDLAKLFPDIEHDPDERGITFTSSLLTWLPGGGGTTYLGILIGNFVEQTLARMRFMDALTENHIEKFVLESLDQIRKFARGEEVEVLVLTGLLGIEVQEPLDRGTWGIRTAQGLAVIDIPPRGQDRPKSVLWAKVPHRLLSRNRADLEEERVQTIFNELSEQASTFHSALIRKTMTLRFGILAWALDRNEQRFVNVQATASWSMFPIASAQPPWVNSPTWPMKAVELTAADLAAIAEVVKEIGEVTQKLEIALNRMVRVASERRDPVDALIDAVIAWENMLGSRSETTFKVCAALSWLLEPEDETRRRALFSKAKKIYGLRSSLVHGSTEADPSQAPGFSQEALLLAVRAFRRIHTDPSLKNLKSSARSEQILFRPKR